MKKVPYLGTILLIIDLLSLIYSAGDFFGVVVEMKKISADKLEWIAVNMFWGGSCLFYVFKFIGNVPLVVACFVIVCIGAILKISSYVMLKKWTKKESRNQKEIR